MRPEASADIQPLRTPAIGWAALAIAGGAAWAVTVDQARAMGAGPGTMDMAFLFFVGMWVAMMAAMMLPAIGPAAAGKTAVSRTREAGGIPRVAAFGIGFLLPWAGYGALAFLALLGTGELVESSPDIARWLGVAILVVAGLYQFSPWKLRALRHCRALMASGPGEGLRGDLVTGVRDGAICVGCCWALMTVLVAVGVMNLLGMAALAALIFAEKILPRPRLIAALGGVGLLVVALVSAFDPSLLPGVTPLDHGVHVDGATMGGMDMGGA